jgi:hypothetical protein
MPLHPALRKEQYDLLPTNECEPDTPVKLFPTPPKQSKGLKILQCLSYFFVAMLGVGVGLFVGKLLESKGDTSGSGHIREWQRSSILCSTIILLAHKILSRANRTHSNYMAS